MSGWSSTRRYRSTLTRPLWPVGNPASATSSGAFTPPAQTNTPPSTSWPSLSRKPSSVAAAIIALVRTWTPRSARILAALPISCGEEPARIVGPASTSTTAGRSGARPWRLATFVSISASSPASSTPVAPLPFRLVGSRGSRDRLAGRLPRPLGVAGRVQRQRALGQAGDGEVVGPAAERQHQPAPADRPRPGEQPPGGQVETSDLGLDEADPRGQQVLERDAYRVGGAGAAGDPGQLGDHLVVVVPVDQGQLHVGVVAQPGRQAQGDVQPGVARAGDHDPAAAPGGGCIHGVLHGYCPPSWGRWLLASHTSLGRPGAGHCFLTLPGSAANTTSWLINWKLPSAIYGG